MRGSGLCKAEGEDSPQPACASLPTVSLSKARHRVNWEADWWRRCRDAVRRGVGRAGSPGSGPAPSSLSTSDSPFSKTQATSSSQLLPILIQDHTGLSAQESPTVGSISLCAGAHCPCDPQCLLSSGDPTRHRLKSFLGLHKRPYSHALILCFFPRPFLPLRLFCQLGVLDTWNFYFSSPEGSGFPIFALNSACKPNSSFFGSPLSCQGDQGGRGTFFFRVTANVRGASISSFVRKEGIKYEWLLHRMLVNTTLAAGALYKVQLYFRTCWPLCCWIGSAFASFQLGHPEAGTSLGWFQWTGAREA